MKNTDTHKQYSVSYYNKKKKERESLSTLDRKINDLFRPSPLESQEIL